MFHRTSRTGSPSGLRWTARAYALSHKEVHRNAPTIRYDRRGRASALVGQTGGGIPAVLGDWRKWSAERDGELEAWRAEAQERLQAAIVRRDFDTINKLVPYVSALNDREPAGRSPGGD